MAIKIPSKNIYEMNNPKIRDNVIDNVEVLFYNANNKYEYMVAVKTIDIQDGFIWQEPIFNASIQNVVLGWSKAYGLIQSCYIKEYLIKFKKFNDNLLINNTFDGVDNEGNSNIKHTVNYDVIKYFITGDDIDVENKSITNKTETYIETKNGVSKIDKVELNVVTELDETIDLPTQFGFANVVLEEENQTNLHEKELIKYDEENDEYYLTITVLSGFVKEWAFSASISGYLSVTPQGYKTIYEPKNLSITIYGDTINIDLSDNSINFNNDKIEKPFSLDRNELLQDSGKVKTIDKNGEEVEKPLTEHLANNVLNQYTKGKETATLLCDIADYYDESGEKVIDIKTNKMSFRLHDEVIPYVFGANGQDQPMSKHQDGSAKVFEVVGSNIIYDGAVWQELTLQEKTQNT